MNQNETIIILGGGISGITTGIVLQVLGFRTKILTRERADRPANRDNPAFASLFPSASIIPHSVQGRDIQELFEDSQHIFELLLSEQAPGVSLNKHYEVFEYRKETPEYARKLKSFRRVDEQWKIDPDIPRMRSTSDLYGWVFDCFFADWPLYMPYLFQWYDQLGGRIAIDELTPERLDQIEEPIVNCLGAGSRRLFDDPSPHLALKGHLVKVSGAPKIQNSRGKTISYNYNPVSDLYTDRKGNRQDLYCYSRSDGWILGGSRLEGTIGSEGEWEGISPKKDLIEINDTEIPAPILEINARILSESYGLSLADYRNREAVVGYRYLRDRENGLRLEQSSEPGKRVIHNYGHGGAGVTLSWGCALKVARWMTDETKGSRTPDPDNFNSVSKALYNHLQRLL